MLDAINQRHEEASTESSLLGPFYRDGVKEAEFGADIAQTKASLHSFTAAWSTRMERRLPAR